MSDVLVVQPDEAQAETLRAIFRRVGAEMVIVDSTVAAMDAISLRMPDLILLSALLSPRDEDTLIGHLRALEDASHLQTITIPQFRKPGAEAPAKTKKGAFGFLKKQKAAPANVGADPHAFADEVIGHLARAREIRARAADIASRVPAIVPNREDAWPRVGGSIVEETPAATPSNTERKGGMGEWRPSIPEPSDAPVYEPAAEQTISDESASHEPVAYEPVAAEPIADEPIVDEPALAPVEPVSAADPAAASAPTPAFSLTDEVDRLVRQLGFNLKVLEPDDAVSAAAVEPAPEAQIDTEAIREAAREEARAAAERAARQAVAADLARMQAEADLREKAIAEAEAKRARDIADAREAAEREAREAVAADLARVQAEAEAMRDRAIAEARAAAEREAREKEEARVAAEREAREAAAADLARMRAEAEAMRDKAIAEAEAKRDRAIAEARAAAEQEAREAAAADLARAQAEAGAMRDRAIAEARAAAEREAREKLEAELARVRTETEVTVTDALNKVKVEAEKAERLRVQSERERAEEAERIRAEAEKTRAESEKLRAEAQQSFAAELARVRAEVEQSLAVQLDAARADAERMRASEAEAVRERAAMEAQLKAELDRLKFVATQARKADENENRKAVEQIKQLENELARVRKQGEERQAAQLEELRAQMLEMREAAAEQARIAAAEAVASQVARATGRQNDPAIRLNVVRMQPRNTQQDLASYKAAAQEIQETLARHSQTTEPSAPSSDYYSLFQTPEPVEAPVVEEPEEETEPFWSQIDYRRHAKWALPAAACLLLLANAGTAISTVKGFVTAEEKPKLTVQPLDVDKPFIEVVEERVGSLKVESTPAGAEVIVDGKSYGATPMTVPDLAVGAHKLELKGSAGTITRRVTIKANQTTMLTEAIYSGWMAIFSPIPVKVVVDGQPVNLTEDSRVMISPGRHTVEFISDQFNFRTTETIDVRPGETTAHTLTLPMGTLRVSAPEGAEIRVDGQPAAPETADGIPVSIGAHEISAVHPDRGERRVSVDVKHGVPTDVSLSYD